MGNIFHKCEMEPTIDLLCLEAYPSDATRLFFAELQQMLKNIKIIQVDVDDLSCSHNNTKPLLIICNHFSRIMSDMQWINTLPHRDGKTILLILYCTTADNLPKSSSKHLIRSHFPAVTDTVEIGFDSHAPWYRKGIYGCQKNDEALMLIKDIASEKSQPKIDEKSTKSQPKIDVDLLVILRCSKASKDNRGMSNAETLNEASKLIHKYVKTNSKCIVVQGAWSYEDWNGYQKPKRNISQTDDGRNSITNDEEEVHQEKISALKFKSYLESQTLKTVDILLDNDIQADMVPLMTLVQSTKEDTKTFEFVFSSLLRYFKNGDVPVILGAYVDDTAMGCGKVVVNENALLKELSNKFNFRKKKCFPSETGTCDGSCDTEDTEEDTNARKPEPVNEHRETVNHENVEPNALICS